MKLTQNIVEKSLKKNNFKLTKQRELIFNVFLENDNHLSADEIFKIISMKNSNIGIATIYRTLLLFENLNIIYKVYLNDDNTVKYELRKEKSENKHQHLICKDCNKIIEVNYSILNDLNEKIKKDFHFKIIDHDLKFFGYCENCYKKIKEKETINEKQ